MFERFKTGWALAKQSFGVLRHDKELVVFPLLSGIACALVLVSFAVPLMSTPWFQELVDDRLATQDPFAYAVLFVFYVVNYFVIVFFNAALVSCALKRLAGGNPTVTYGLREACNRLPQIAAWALTSGTVGFVLKLIESRSERVGRFVASLIGAGWSIATYFVVPVLVVERVGPLEALKRSTGIIRRTWGEALVSNMGIGLLVFLAMLPAPAFFAAAGLLGAEGGAGGGIAMLLFGIGIAWVIGVWLVSAAVQSILLAALYLYAAQKEVPSGFDAEVLQSAFGAKH